jgi:hypothetical protein
MHPYGRRAAHPKRVIERALRFAEERGCRVEEAGRSSHARGRIYATGDGAAMSVLSTPRSAEVHAKQVRRFAERFGRGE